VDLEEEEEATEVASEAVEEVTVVASEEAEAETVGAEVAVVEMVSKEAEAVAVLALEEVLKSLLNLMKDSKEFTFLEEKMTPYLPRTLPLERVSTMKREFQLM